MSASAHMRPRSVELVGAGAMLFLVAGSWAMTARTAGSASALPVATLILATGLILTGSWIVATRWAALVPCLLVAWALALLLSDPSSVLRLGPFQGPFGYANATAAFFAIVTIAALLVVVNARHMATRVVGTFAAAGFLPVIAFSRSWAVTLLLPSVVIVVLLVARYASASVAVGFCAALFVTALSLTQLLGATRLGSGTGPVDRAIEVTLSSDRVILWNEAMSVMLDAPLRGIGPGRFSSASSFAAADVDRRYAHNEFLQAGVAAGIPGYVLSVAFVVWGFAALARAPRGLAAPLAAASLAITGVHATIDYIAHFPAIMLALAAVVGTGLGSPGTRGWASVPSLKEAP